MAGAAHFSSFSFHKYYSGQLIAPILTIFIGGNHEASNHLWELYHGGWVAPNIFFLGYSGAITVGGVRIAGLSGIYKSMHYRQGHWEHPPYDQSSMRSAYHVREYEVWKLGMMTGHVDIFLSHDWPRFLLLPLSATSHAQVALQRHHQAWRREAAAKDETLPGGGSSKQCAGEPVHDSSP